MLDQFLRPVWVDAEAAMVAAERIVFMGYSLPELDIRAERLFRKSIFANTEAKFVDIINPSPSAAQRFVEVSSPRPVRWFGSAESFLGRGGFA